MLVEPAGSNRRWMAIGAVIAIGLGLLVAFVLSRQESGSDVVMVPTETPTPVETPGASETPPPSEPPSPTEPATAAPSEPSEAPTADSGQAQPSDADVAAFVAAHGPGDATGTGDVVGDATEEVVVAAVRNDAVAIVVGAWDGQAYQPTYRGEGGPAQRVTAVTVAEHNGQPGAEIVTEQRAGTEGRSISVWGPAGGVIKPQEAKGGCWAGFATYGITGASIAAGRIAATCDGSPEPPDSWASDIYEWRKGRWTYVRTQEPGE